LALLKGNFTKEQRASNQ